jgi:hypothetical protein
VTWFRLSVYADFVIAVDISRCFDQENKFIRESDWGVRLGGPCGLDKDLIVAGIEEFQSTL